MSQELLSVSQGGVATHTGCVCVCAIFGGDFVTNSVSKYRGERILKIGPHLAKLRREYSSIFDLQSPVTQFFVSPYFCATFFVSHFSATLFFCATLLWFVSDNTACDRLSDVLLLQFSAVASVALREGPGAVSKWGSVCHK